VPVDSDQKRTRRDQSASLFNNRYFADVVLAIQELAPPPDGIVTTRQVASYTGLADSLIRPVMLRLIRAEILFRLPRLGGGRSAQYLSVNPERRWEHLLGLVQETQRAEARGDTAGPGTPAST
jgi:hypothetical protein